MKWTLWIIFISNIYYVLAVGNNVCRTKSAYLLKTTDCWYDPDLESTTPEIIARRGYPVNSYSVTTKDGFILNVFRIPHNGKNENAKRQPVFLQHGMLQNSIIWVDTGNRSLAFVLSNLGYDVWMGNTRGSTHSNEHVKFSQDDNEYWDHTLDSFGHYDMPAVTDLIFNTTKQKVIFIGYSQGITQSYIYAIDNKTHAEERVKGLISFGAVAFLANLPVVKYVAPIGEPIARLLYRLGVNYVGLGQNAERIILTNLCLLSPLQIDICTSILELDYGKNAGNQWSPDIIPAMVTNFMDRESILPVVQYLQMANSERFETFDYGKERNMQLYGQEKPKEYDLAKIGIPVYLFYGDNDLLAPPENVARIYEKLQAPKMLIKIGDKYPFNHNHFVYSNRVEEEFYTKLLPLMEELKRL